MATQPRPSPLRRWIPITALAVVASAMAVAASLSPQTSASGAAQPYTFTTIDVPNATKTFGMGNNAAGDVVGYFVDASAPFHGFVLKGGTFSTLDFPGDNIAWTQANAINDAGDITGNYSLKAPAPTGNVHGFLLTSDGKWSTVDYPEEGHIMSGGGYAIANDRTVFGCFHDGVPMTAMFGYSLGSGGTSRFEYPAAGTAFAMHYGATPDGKTIVGSYRAGGTTMESWHGFVIAGGQTISFDVPGQLSTNALGIRQSPDVSIVGTYKVLVDKTWNQHGYVAATQGSLDPAKWNFTMVDVPDTLQTIVRGINPSGNLVGTYIDAAGNNHAFTAAPGASGSPAAPPPPAAGNNPAPGAPGTGNTLRNDGYPLPPAITAGLVLMLLGTCALAAAATTRKTPRNR